MYRIRRLIRRSFAAALRAPAVLVSAVRGRGFRLLVALYRAIDTAAVVRVRYTDAAGVVTVRDISPRRLWLSNDGDVLVTAYDHLRDDRRDFRTDRIQTA